jgi:hypothetical protein
MIKETPMTYHVEVVVNYIVDGLLQVCLNYPIFFPVIPSLSQNYPLITSKLYHNYPKISSHFPKNFIVRSQPHLFFTRPRGAPSQPSHPGQRPAPAAFGRGLLL